MRQNIENRQSVRRKAPIALNMAPFWRIRLPVRQAESALSGAPICPATKAASTAGAGQARESGATA
jgi:hypothetical protein